MRKKLFILCLVVIDFLTSFFVTWFVDSGLYTRITAVWFMAAFTVVLAIATIWNIKITRGLLKQSKEVFKQSKRALESSIFREIVSSTLQLNAILRNDWYLKCKEKRTPYIENSVAGMLIALKNVDHDMFKKISETIKTWKKTDNRTPATIFSEALEMVEKGIDVE